MSLRLAAHQGAEMRQGQDRPKPQEGGKGIAVDEAAGDRSEIGPFGQAQYGVPHA